MMMTLTGRRVLLVEDDFFILSDLVSAVTETGAEVAGAVANVSDALRLIRANGRIDGAILDINLGGEMVFPVADALQARRIPFLFATGYDAEIVPERHADALLYEKPVDMRRCISALFSAQVQPDVARGA